MKYSAIQALQTAGADFSQSVRKTVSPPEGWWEYVIVGIAVAIALYALGRLITSFCSNREEDPDHIKRQVLEDDFRRRD